MTDTLPTMIEFGNGAAAPLRDIDAVVRVVAIQITSADKLPGTLIWIARKCSMHGEYRLAHAYLERALLLQDDPQERARTLLLMGSFMESTRDYAAALADYSSAFVLPQQPDAYWYFLNNNLGFCLNLFGRHAEAEIRCRAAVAIDFQRSNAHKNLGVALEGQARLVDAARAYLTATEVCPTDRRSIGLLEALLAKHPETTQHAPDVLERMLRCGTSPGASSFSVARAPGRSRPS